MTFQRFILLSAGAVFILGAPVASQAEEGEMRSLMHEYKGEYKDLKEQQRDLNKQKKELREKAKKARKDHIEQRKERRAERKEHRAERIEKMKERRENVIENHKGHANDKIKHREKMKKMHRGKHQGGADGADMGEPDASISPDASGVDAKTMKFKIKNDAKPVKADAKSRKAQSRKSKNSLKKADPR